MTKARARINRIKLKNIKSFKDGEVSFSDGITVISGENGCGKSTLFEAVGYALFGVKTNDFIGKVENFVRYGQKSGEIEVEYTGVDGVEYSVRRSMKGSAQIKRMTPDGWFPVEEASSEEHICTTLGLNSSSNLSSQFQEIIGPFQSDFITPFFVQGKERETRFDRILGIDRWRKLYDKTQGAKAEFERRIKEAELEISLHQKNIEDLPDTEDRSRQNKELQFQLSSDIDKLSIECESLDVRLKKLEEVEKRINEIKNNIELNLSLKTNKISDIAARKTELEQAGESAKIVLSSREGYEKYIAAAAQKAKLEEKREQKDKLLAGESSLNTEIAAEKAALDAKEDENKKQIESVKKALALLEPEKIERQTIMEKIGKELEVKKKRVDELKTASDELSVADTGIITRAKTECRLLADRAKSIGADIEEKKKSLLNIESLKTESKKISVLEEEIDALKDALSAKKHDINERNKGKEALIKGKCPFFGENCLNLSGKDPEEFFGSIIKTIEKESEELQGKIRSLELQLSSARTAEMELTRLIETEKSLSGDEANLKKISDEIKNLITPSEIDELILRISKAASGAHDAGIDALYGDLKIKISSIKAPDKITDYPEFINLIENTINSIFQNISDKLKSISSSAALELQSASELHAREEAAHKSCLKEIAKAEAGIKEAEAALFEIKNSRKALLDKEQELKELKQRLSEYKTLDEELAKTNNILKETAELYNLYNIHLKTSEKVGQLKNEVAEMEKEIARLEALISTLTAEISALSSGFNEEELKAAREDHIKKAEARSAMREQLAALKKEHEALKKSIEEKKNIRKAIAKMRKNRDELEKSKKFADFIRNNILKEIAPYMATVLRKRISAIANEIYRDISGRQEELEWGENYSLSLKDIADGKERIRTDRQLSGGQFMSAVIAVRMALLQITGSPFAFFDEPTSNLDEERRKNLAEAFRRMESATINRWYRQLFLVSHDESFQDISSNIIELELDEKRCTKIKVG